MARSARQCVSAAGPLLRIQEMVTRKGENGIVYGGNQRVTVEEAIKVWAQVLRKDPRKVPPDTIKDIIVDATYVGGKNVWQAPKNALALVHHLVSGIDFGDGDEEENLNHVDH